jgi:DNA-binding NtrC family response regulator
MARILVVDDDSDVLELLGSVLEGDGHEVSTANDGEHALMSFSAGSFDVVVTDVRMPGQDGFDLLDHIRDRSPSLPVILVTGKASPQGALKSVYHEAFGYVEKPFDTTYLLSLVDRAIRLSHHRRVRNVTEREE